MPALELHFAADYQSEAAIEVFLMMLPFFEHYRRRHLKIYQVVLCDCGRLYRDPCRSNGHAAVVGGSNLPRGMSDSNLVIIWSRGISIRLYRTVCEETQRPAVHSKEWACDHIFDLRSLPSQTA